MKTVFKEIDPGQPLLAAPGRSCGSCTACCYTVPVSEIGVAAFQRCPKLLGPPDMRIGCSVYADRPHSCRTWSCSWLIGELPDEYRPDRLGIVSDPLPDLCRINGQEVTAAQFWVMPGHEDDWKLQKVTLLILNIIDSTGMAVLWRMRDPEGGQMACIFARGSDGKYGRSSVSKSMDDGYTEGERLRRAQELLR